MTKPMSRLEAASDPIDQARREWVLEARRLAAQMRKAGRRRERAAIRALNEGFGRFDLASWEEEIRGYEAQIRQLVTLIASARAIHGSRTFHLVAVSPCLYQRVREAVLAGIQ